MTTLAPSIVTVRDPKGLKFVSIVESVYNKARLSEEEAQRVNQTPGLSALVDDFIGKNRHIKLFADEEEWSDSGYACEPKEIYVQCQILRTLFPGLGTAAGPFEATNLVHQFGAGNIAGAPYAEGWFAVPNWAKHPEIFGRKYAEAVQKMLGVLKRATDGKFCNYWEDCINERRLRQLDRTEKSFRKVSEVQGNPDILVFPAQFGLRHRGRSVRRARAIMSQCEYGLGAFAVGCMLLTHPERLKDYDDLWIDLPGDEFDTEDEGEFSHSLFFANDDRIVFDTTAVNTVDGRYGSATGFML